MSQLTLEVSNQEDLDLLVSFAKRLNMRILSLSAVKNKKTLMQQAANDPLFLSDITEISTDFKHADNEI